MKASRYGDDIEIAYGRRLGWYAIARVKKPKVLIETGVDHGVGSCVLASALLRNAAEGHPGRYYGTEIRPEAGALFTGEYATVGRILYGDSIQSLTTFAEPIDMFVNDSDHSGEYEYREYQTISEKLSIGAIILGDNAHVTDSLSRFSRETGRKFVFFSEKPLDHWYPGAGIGISF
ncbi:class I SAM-dependent methyltransferase [Rhizobium aouanii]